MVTKKYFTPPFRLVGILLLVFLVRSAFAQTTDWNDKTFLDKAISIPDSVHKTRLLGVSATYGASWTGTLIALNEIWYKDYPKSKFHTFDDSGEWLQVDKIGHAYSAYRLSLGFSSALQWSGVDKDRAVYIGALSGILSQSVIEILDGYSAEWGFSWSDMAANTFGSGMYAGQHALWGEQRIWFKFSTHKYLYPKGMLQTRADQLYGTTPFELLFKDYNAQTYWFSANIHSFFPKSNVPTWLNVAVGYGADGMFGGYKNVWVDEKTNIAYNRTDIPRTRQLYLAPDIDLSRIKTNSKILGLLFKTFNLKTPLPTLEIKSNGKLKLRPLYF